MSPPDSGPEPTGWELMRAIVRLENLITNSANASVQQKVYDSDRTGNDDRHARAEARIRDLETRNANEAQQRQHVAEEAEKMRRQQKLTISLAIASPFLAAIVGIIMNGLTP